MILPAQASTELTALVPLDPNLPIPNSTWARAAVSGAHPAGPRRSQGCAMHVGVIPLHGPVGDDRLYPLR